MNPTTYGIIKEARQQATMHYWPSGNGYLAYKERNRLYESGERYVYSTTNGNAPNQTMDDVR